MYLSQVASRTRRRVAQGASLPAPVKGWNARDPLDGMDPGYAIRLDNFFPRPGSVDLRAGYAQHATGVGTSSSNVETLMTYQNDGTNKMLAASNGAVFDVTAAAAGTSLATGYTNNRWQWADFNKKLLFVNGEDDPQVYDGSTVTAAGFTGSGLTPANLVGVVAHKSRLFFIEKDTANFWYGGINAITGTLSKFPLAEVYSSFGDLMAIAIITLDGGSGPDDLIAFISSTGRVILYQGTDPSSADTWSIVGRFEIGSPIGRRPVLQTGPDAAVVTADGYIPLLKVMRQGRASAAAYAISDTIQGAVNDAVRDYGGNFGWQGLLYPKANMAIFNIPAVEGTRYEQHVLNTQTGAWCRFTGIPAVCWVVFQDEAYLGSVNGTVYKFDSGVNDNGAAILGDAQTAFHYLGGRGSLKNFHLYRPIVSSDGVVPIQMGLGVDFDENIPVTATTSTVAVGGEWNSAEWDAADWASGARIQKDWQSAATTGYSASTRIKVSTATQQVKWFATDYTFEKGGFL